MGRDGLHHCGSDSTGDADVVEGLFTVLLWAVIFGGSCLLVAGVLWLMGKAMDWWLED